MKQRNTIYVSFSKNVSIYNIYIYIHMCVCVCVCACACACARACVLILNVSPIYLLWIQQCESVIRCTPIVS